MHIGKRLYEGAMWQSLQMLLEIIQKAILKRNLIKVFSLLMYYTSWYLYTRIKTLLCSESLRDFEYYWSIEDLKKLILKGINVYKGFGYIFRQHSYFQSQKIIDSGEIVSDKGQQTFQTLWSHS